MSGKFIDTAYTDTIDNLVKATTSKINNPYYKFSDQKPTKTTYWAQSIEKSTLDQASGLYGAHLGKESPFKFNKVNNMLLYGLDKINTDLDVGDYGVEANSITGDAVILPNTITPRPGDFFCIPYIKEDILFKVISATTDTLDSGATMYKIEYSLELTNSIAQIESQTENTYEMIVNNIGTDFKTILQSSDCQLIEKLESVIGNLIVCFRDIFFDTRLQTFVFSHNGTHLYDPYLIEFLIRNKVLDYGGEYVFVSHAAYTGKTFGMDYMRTFFKYLENPEECPKFNTIATGEMIQDQNSLFVTRIDDYYMIKYVDKHPYGTRFYTIDPDVISHIKSGEKYNDHDEKAFYNIWISFFNDDTNFINGNTVNSIMKDLILKLDTMDSMESFYALPITIYMLENYIRNLMRR